MSLDNQATLNLPDMHDDKPKSSPLKWILGGCGCLGLLAAICVGGFVLFFWTTIQDMQQMPAETKALIENSSVVSESLGGAPVFTGGPRVSPGPEGEFNVEFDVEGPNGSGTVFSKAKPDPQTRRLERIEFYLELNGERIDLDPEADLSFELEGLEE